jgi:hypothetical protein
MIHVVLLQVLYTLLHQFLGTELEANIGCRFGQKWFSGWFIIVKDIKPNVQVVIAKQFFDNFENEYATLDLNNRFLRLGDEIIPLSPSVDQMKISTVLNRTTSLKTKSKANRELRRV